MKLGVLRPGSLKPDAVRSEAMRPNAVKPGAVRQDSWKLRLWVTLLRSDYLSAYIPQHNMYLCTVQFNKDERPTLSKYHSTSPVMRLDISRAI